MRAIHLAVPFGTMEGTCLSGKVGGGRIERERPRSRDWQPKETKMSLKSGHSQAVFESDDATPGFLRNRKSRDDFSAGWLF